MTPLSEKSAPDAAFPRGDRPSSERQRRCAEATISDGTDFHQSKSGCAGVISSDGSFSDRDPSSRAAAAWFDRARSELCAAHPYLGFALARLEPAASERFTLPATDGARLWLNPAHLPEGPAALFLRMQARGEDGDENEVVDAQHDLEHDQGAQPGPGRGIGDPREIPHGSFPPPCGSDAVKRDACGSGSC